MKLTDEDIVFQGVVVKVYLYECGCFPSLTGSISVPTMKGV